MALTAALVVIGDPGQAQNATDLTRRVQQLEQQVRALPGGTGGGAAAARMEVRQSQLEEELRTLTGRVEDLNYQVRQIGEKLDRLSADLDYRLGEAGTDQPSANAAQSLLEPPLPPGTGTADPPSLSGLPNGGPSQRAPRPARGAGVASGDAANVAESPRAAYAQAYDLLRQGRYEQAAAAFSDFLARYPDDPLADNAQYWLGESFYARGEFDRATAIFVDGYQSNKSGAKAPDTLLKLGMSLAALGKDREACATFRELGKAFPDASPAVREKAAQEGQRAGCS